MTEQSRNLARPLPTWSREADWGGAGQPATRAEVLRNPSPRWGASGTCLAPKQNPGKCADFLGLSKLKLNSPFPPTGVRANRAILPVESKKIRVEGNEENEGF
jgi:hypothetical protein